MTWQTLPIGAGGIIRGLDIHSDGTKVIRTDTYGAYVWGGSSWRQLCVASAFAGDSIVTYTSLNSGSPTGSIANGPGVFSIKIAPSNSNRLYMLWLGYLYTSTDKGVTWTRTALPADTTHVPNDQSDAAGWDYKIAIDPHNEQIVVVGTGAGIRYSLNAGANWTTISTVLTPTSNIGACCIAFDPASWTSSNTPGIYIASYGRGIYHSSAGPGGTFSTVTSGGPTICRHMRCGPDGTLYAVSTASTFYVFNAGGSNAWTTTVPSGASSLGAGGLSALAIDPSTSGTSTRIAVADSTGNIALSTNRGISFSAFVTAAWGDTSDIPWMAKVGYPTFGEGTFLTSDIAFDPTGSNKLYMAGGVGIVWSNPTTSAITWNDQSLGIEQLVVTSMRSIPGGNLIVTCMDRPVFSLSVPTFPSAYGTNYIGTSGLDEGWAANISPSGNVVVMVSGTIIGGRNHSAYSTDGGATWANFTGAIADQSPFRGGQMAAASATNFVMLVNGSFTPAHSGVWRTINAGATWTDITISGVSGPIPGWNGDGAGNPRYRRSIIDCDTAGNFYAYNYGNADGTSTSTPGVYVSTNGGASFALTAAGSFFFDGGGSGASIYTATMRAVPGQAGHLFFTSGNQSDQPTTVTPFWRTINGSTTWTAVSGVTMVQSFGFGKAKTGGSGYPAIFIYGCVGGSSEANLGVWQSDDSCATWTKIGGIFPNDWVDIIMSVEGDMNVYGRCYVAGGNGSGAAFFDPTVVTGSSWHVHMRLKRN